MIKICSEGRPSLLERSTNIRRLPGDDQRLSGHGQAYHSCIGLIHWKNNDNIIVHVFPTLKRDFDALSRDTANDESDGAVMALPSMARQSILFRVANSLYPEAMVTLSP
jgi:hypothetical protein